MDYYCYVIQPFTSHECDPTAPVQLVPTSYTPKLHVIALCDVPELRYIYLWMQQGNYQSAEAAQQKNKLLL